jgi:hypothetical protein
VSSTFLLASIDALGLGMFVFVALLFGIPYTRFFLRKRAIPSWPTAQATITEAFVRRGLPGTYDVLIYYCDTYYIYEVRGTTYRSRAILGTGNRDLAAAVAQQVLQMRIPIRYNPKRPKDSLPLQEKIAGGQVIQRQNWWNPNVW